MFSSFEALPLRRGLSCRLLQLVAGGIVVAASLNVRITLAADAQPLSLRDALRLATEISPQLTAQRAAVTAADDAIGPARELPDPKLVLGIDSLPLSGPDQYSIARDSFTMRRFGISQDFPRAEKRELKGRRAEQEAARERAMLIDTRAAVRRDVAIAYMDRYFAERMAAVVNEQYAEVELQYETMQAGLRSGKAQAAELLALRVNLQSLLDRQADFEKQAARAKALLSRWVRGESDRPLAPLPDNLKVADLGDLSTHIAHHPHLQVLEKQVEVAQTEANLARASKKSDWGVDAAYQLRGSSFPDYFSVSVRIDLPIFQGRRQDRDVAGKLALVEQAQAQREDSLQQHLAEAKAAWEESDAARRRLERFDQALLPLSRERIDAALSAYRGGQGTLAAVLDARRAELDLKLQQTQLAADQARAYAQLIYFLPEENTK